MTIKLRDCTPDQILALNHYQNGPMHAFTCPKRDDGDHRYFNGDVGALVATRYGWICPWCEYEQDWAHEIMAEGKVS